MSFATASISMTKPRSLEPMKQSLATPTNPLKRPLQDVTEKNARPRVMLTPPSSDGHVPSDEVSFKVPALPQRVRLMTPSSSTVAASSSPAPFSSPDGSRKRTAKGISKGVGEIIEVKVEAGLTYLFGRHRHHDHQTTSTSSLPPILSTSLSQPPNPIRTIFLPRTASYASRLHAAIEYLAATDELRLVVAGQNGVRIRSKSVKRRLGKGESVTVKREEQIKLNFYGCTALLQLPQPTSTRDDLSLFSPSSSPVRQNLASLPPSSPPLEPASDDEDGQSIPERSSSPLSPIVETASLETDLEVKAEALEAMAKAASPVPAPRPVSRAATPVKEAPPVPDNVDLPALIASTVVFSGSSKLSQPDLVKHMLESQPSFKETASEETWNAWVGAELESNAMFGKVSRVGKDASGHPLLPHYFYVPDEDPDMNRARELGGLVRPLRTVQRAGGKAIDWRPVGSGRRRYW